MRRSLLDVDVLLALLDADHADHAAAGRWLDGAVEQRWATCPITENGFVRILSQPRYPSPVSPGVAADLLRDARAGGRHEFWPDSVSVLDRADTGTVHGHGELTDAYLLAPAADRGGRYVTFDRRVRLQTVAGAGPEHLLVLG